MKTFKEYIGENYLRQQKFTLEDVLEKDEEMYSIFRDWTKILEEEVNALDNFGDAEVGLYIEGVSLSATYNNFIDVFYEIDRFLTDGKVRVSLHFNYEHNDLEKPDVSVLVPYVELLSEGYNHYNALHKTIRYAMRDLRDNPDTKTIEII